MNPEDEKLTPEEKFNRDIDQVLNIVQKNYEEKRQQRMTDEMLRMFNNTKTKSVKSPQRRTTPQKYQPKKKKVSVDFIRGSIIAIAASAVLIGSIGLGLNGMKNTNARIDFTDEISEHVRDNVIYTEQLDSSGRAKTWYYDDVGEIARETLEENQNVDIDTRIYGTYMGLQSYQRDEYMNRVMRNLQRIVEENPLDYDEETVRACNHTTFTDYLADLNMDKETYIEKMQEIATAYGREDFDRVAELLEDFRGGQR